MDKVYYWMGRPLSELPREELEREFVRAQQEIDDLLGKNLEISTRHIRDLAALARQRHG